MPKLLYCMEALEKELAELGKLGRPFHAKDEGLVVYSSELHTSLGVYSSRESVGVIGSVDEISRFLASLGCFASLSELYFKYYPAESKGWPEFIHYQTLMQTLDLQQLGWYCLQWLVDRFDLAYSATSLSEDAVLVMLREFEAKAFSRSIHEVSRSVFYLSNLLTACAFCSHGVKTELDVLFTEFGEKYYAYSISSLKIRNGQNRVFLHEKLAHRLFRPWDVSDAQYYANVADIEIEKIYRSCVGVRN